MDVLVVKHPYVVHEEDNDIRRLRCGPTKTVTMEIGFVFLKKITVPSPSFFKKKLFSPPLLCIKRNHYFSETENI